MHAGTYAPAPTERVHTVLAWVQQVLIERIQAGGVKAAPPIQSRIHQVLSDSMLGYEQCKCARRSHHFAASDAHMCAMHLRGVCH